MKMEVARRLMTNLLVVREVLEVSLLCVSVVVASVSSSSSTAR